ncbi:hypothetical protein C9439_03055 [archaeon SCG-AAA382B04]|nr:hypothetical protein C9439_03055 [archaeon SCG-AAA382B04]
MTKKMTSVKIDEEIHKWAKNYGINVSQFLKNKLSETRNKLKEESNKSLVISSQPSQET